MPLTTVNPELYSQLLEDKIAGFKQSLAGLGEEFSACPMAVFSSPENHYRLRAEFKVWHEGDVSHYAMTDPATKKPVFVQEFPVACEAINRLMPPVLATINADTTLRRKLFQIEFLSTLTEDTLVTLIYHRPLDEQWIEVARELKDKLNINIIGRSRKQKLVLDRDYVTEQLKVEDKTYSYQQIEGSFTQPNGRVCEEMLSWAVNNSINSEGDLLELYCGNGNFTLPLAQNFRRVLATEISKTSVASAQKNLQDNHIDNVVIVRMSSEEFVQAQHKEREFRRLQHIDLDDYQFSTVFVDPPRSGLDEATVKMVQAFDRIIYISCNPQTLVANLQVLKDTHRLTALAAFDQFPYTPHLEAGVILNRR